MNRAMKLICTRSLPNLFDIHNLHSFTLYSCPLFIIFFFFVFKFSQCSFKRGPLNVIQRENDESHRVHTKRGIDCCIHFYGARIIKGIEKTHHPQFLISCGGGIGLGSVVQWVLQTVPQFFFSFSGRPFITLEALCRSGYLYHLTYHDFLSFQTTIVLDEINLQPQVFQLYG